MAANLFPVDAVSGAPSYTGRAARQTLGGLWTKATSRLLGARSGLHPATIGATIVTATSTTWTVLPHTGVLDLEANAIAGPYDYSFDANQTGSVTAADVSNPRVDSLFVQLSDPAEGDGTSTPNVVPVYVAGIAGAAGGARGAAGGPPNFPNTRCMELAQINVPKSGGGSPTVSMVAPYAVASGGILPVANQAARDALTAYSGLMVWRLDTQRVEVYSGSAWTTAAAGDSGWLTATLGNSWVAFGAPYATPAYRLRSGIVYLGGLMKNGTAPVSVVFTLPVGYRPASSLQFNVVAAASTALIQVDATGAVNLQAYGTGGSNTAVSLNGVTFVAEQ